MDGLNNFSVRVLCLTENVAAQIEVIEINFLVMQV